MKSINLCFTFQNDSILEENLVLAVGSGQRGLVVEEVGLIGVVGEVGVVGVVGEVGVVGVMVWSGCSGTIFLSILSVTDENDRTRDDGTL